MRNKQIVVIMLLTCKEYGYICWLQGRVMTEADRSELLNVPPRNNNTFLHAPLNKKAVVEVSQNMKMPLFPYDEGYKYLPENMDSYEITVFKKIKGKYYISAIRTEKGELSTDFFDPYDFSKADILENFGKGTYRVTLAGVISGQDEKVDVWQRNIKLNDGQEIPFNCPDGVFMDNELIAWDKYYAMKKEEEEEEEEEETPNKPLGSFLGKFGLSGLSGKNNEKEEEEEETPAFNLKRPSLLSRENEEEEEEETPDEIRNGVRNIDRGFGFRDRNVDERGMDRDRDRDRDRLPLNRYDSRYSGASRDDESDVPSWAKKLEEKLETKLAEIKPVEEKSNRPLIPPELVALAGTALTAIFTNMQESARRREEDERRRYEAMQEERRREFEMRRADEERKRDEDKRKWEEERKREEQRRNDDEKRREDERRAEDKRREDERRRYDELKREEDRRAEALREEMRAERERVRAEKDLLDRERIKMSQGMSSQSLNPQIVEIMKKVDRLQEEKIEKIKNSGDLKSNLFQMINEFKEVKDTLVELGLAQPPEASSGGIEGFVGRVMQNMEPEKAAILAQAVFEKVGPMLGFGGQPAAELPSEIDVG